jgi:hypothetical protein
MKKEKKVLKCATKIDSFFISATIFKEKMNFSGLLRPPGDAVRQ